MQFEMFFNPCRFDKTQLEEMQNPFTGKTSLAPINRPLTPAELSAVLAVLDKAGAKGPDEFNSYEIHLGDLEVRVYASDLAHGCMVSFRSLPLSLFQFAFELMKAGNWVMLPSVETTFAITSSMEAVQGVPDDYPPIVVCDSAEELLVLVSRGDDAWREYRDQRGSVDT